MNFKDFLKVESAKVETASSNLLSQWEKEVNKTSKTLIPLTKAFKKANKGGKVIRGVLCELGYEIASSKSDKEIIKVAAAYEIFHTSILAHDDIIDQSVIRRGQSSLYQSLGGDHFGISQAICLADAGFFLAIKIISESSFPDSEKNKAIRFFAETMLDTAMGQMLDISGGDLTTIMKLKTAKYTIAGPLQIGAILAGGKDELIKVLGEFGEDLGIAFQIQDDILDGDAEEVELAKYKALKYAAKAKKIIPKISSNVKIRNLLEEMCVYLVERTL